MQAKSDPSDQARAHSGLPLSTDPWEARGGSVWVAGGVCALALAAVFHFKLDPEAGRARNGTAFEEPPAAPTERAEEAVLPSLRGDAPSAVPAQPGSAKLDAEEPAASAAPSPGEQSPKAARKFKRTAARQPTTPLASPAPPTLSEHGVAPLEEEVPAPVPPPDSARATAIPDNPY